MVLNAVISRITCLVYLGALVLALTVPTYATDFHVAPDGHDDNSGLSWDDAKQTIQAAVDLTVDGDTVIVTNGLYNSGSRSFFTQLPARLVITNAITVRSVNGPEVTTIEGHPESGADAVRCVYMGENSIVSGFSLKNGAGLTTGSIFRDMSAGGAYCAPSSVLTNCILTGNAGVTGGATYRGTLINCTLTNNYCTRWGGASRSSTLINCLVVDNSAGLQGGGVYQGNLINSTLIGNTAANEGGGAFAADLINCIVYFNAAPIGANHAASLSVDYTCTTPLPPGTGNISSDPKFVDYPGGDFGLKMSSPCIDAGDTSSSFGTTDLVGNARIAGNGVDIGAYESQYVEVRVSAVGGTTTGSGVYLAGEHVLISARSANAHWQFSAWDDGDTGASRTITVPTTPITYVARFVETVGPMTTYVARDNPAPVWPHITWATAATSIQDAVDAAIDGDSVIVSNGVYASGSRAVTGVPQRNRVVLDKAIRLQSLHGPTVTRIQGGSGVRCLYLGTNVTVAGFTLSGGRVEDLGGGIYNGLNSTSIFEQILFEANSAIGASGSSAGRDGTIGRGGAIYNEGALTLHESELVGNIARGGAGRSGERDDSDGERRSGVDGGNGAAGIGGGIYNKGEMAMTASTVSSNSALGGASGPAGESYNTGGVDGGTGGDGLGGGIYNTGMLTLNRSTVSGNTTVGQAGREGEPGDFDGATGGAGGDGGTGLGGGIHNAGALTLIRSTIAANTVRGGSGQDGAWGDGDGSDERLGRGGDGGDGGVSLGGGIYNSGTLAMRQVTLASNQVFLATTGGMGGRDGDRLGTGLPGSSGRSQGGGIYNLDSGGCSLRGSLVARNVAETHRDLSGAFFSDGYNLLGEQEGNSGFTNGIHHDLVGTAAVPIDPWLGPLADNGGPTQTMALGSPSPAIDRGDDVPSETSDQRGAGFPRLAGSRVDVGAYELDYRSPQIMSLSTPTVTSDPDSTLSSMGIDLSAYPNGRTTAVWVEYGPTPSYGTRTAPITLGYGFEPVHTNITLTGLLGGLNWHYRVVTSSPAGTSSSSNQTFTTQAFFPPGDSNRDGVVSKEELNAVYGSYITQGPPLHMTEIAGLGTARVTFSLEDTGLDGFSVESSTNLLQWNDLGPALPRFEFTDTNAPAAQNRHYRLTYP